MAAANRDDDPTTWFPVAKVPAATSGTTAPAANDDPTTWFPVGTVKEKPPPGGGVIRNIGAGSAEGGAGGINFMSDPVGSLGQMALTAGGTAYDAAAPYVGLPRMTPAFRNFLYGTADADIPQPGTRLMNTIMAANPEADRPGSVPATTPAERIARAGAAGAVAGTMLPNPLLGPLSGAAGAVTGEEAGRMAPEWAQPGVQLLGNVLGGGIVLGAPAAYNALKPGLARLSEGGIQLPPGVSPLSPEATALYDAQQAARRTPGVSAPPPTEPPAGGASAPAEGPSPGMGGPAPRAAGAAASTAAEAALTPQQAAEYGSVADKQWLYKTMRPGEADPTEYVRGISPTMAQREQTVRAARDTKTARNLSKEADQAERELLDDHNTIRKNDYAEVAGSDVTQGIAIRDANDAIDKGLTRAYQAGGEVEAKPIAEAIQAELNGPAGKLPPVKSVMKALNDALEKPDGTGLETDPRQVHGVRRVINFLQSKHGIAENPAYGSPDVQAALVRVKEVLDGQMEPAAPGFGKAIADYATAQRSIEAAEALQKAEPKLLDDKGRMQFSRFHRFMNEVVQSRDPKAPLNPWQSLTPEQMNRLKSLHDDLQRVASAEDLAKARGSDTTMNILDAVKHAAQGVPGTVASGVVGHLFGGPVGATVAPIIKGQIEGVFTRGAERRATKTMENLLRPDPAKFPTRPNPFTSPEP